MKKSTVKKVLLTLLIVTVLIATYFNISKFIANIPVALNGATSVSNSSAIGSNSSYGNMALFIFIILFYGYKKRNLWWILLPYLGTIIFGLMKLIEKEEEHEKAE